MSVDVGSAIGYLELDTSGFRSGFKSALHDINSFGDKSKVLESRMAGMGRGFTALGSNMTAGISLPLVALGTLAVKVGNDFQQQMSRVQGISGATKKELALLEQQAIDLGASTAFSATEAAEGMENLASAGFNVTEIMAAMPGMMDLAASDGLDLATAADIAASALRGFGLEATESARVADVMARAAADTNAGVTDMGESMKYIAPVAHAMGQSLEDTAAAIGIMADAGIKGSQAGTTLRGALTRLVKPTDAMYMTMERLGLEFFNTEGQMKSLGDIMGMLDEKMAHLTEQERNKAMATLFGQQALSGMLVLMEKGQDDFDALADSLRNSGGAAQEMATIMQDNAKSAIEEMFGAFESASIQIQKVLDPMIRAVADTINEWVTSFAEMDETTLRTVVVVAALVAAIGPALLIIGKVITLVSALPALLLKVKTAFVALNLIMALNPVGAIVTGIALLVAGLTALVLWVNRSTDAQKKAARETKKIVEANEDLTKSIEDSQKAFEERNQSIEVEAGTAKKLADRVYDLAEQENKSAEQKRQLTVMVGMLNEAMGETVLSYNAETDAMNKTRTEMDQLIQSRMEQAKVQAEQERAVEVAKELATAESQLNDITRRRIQLDIEKADGVYDNLMGTSRYTKQVVELDQAEAELNESIAGLTQTFEYHTEQVVKGSEEQAEAHAHMGEQFIAINGQIMASQDDVDKKNKELLESMDEYVAAVTSMFAKINEEAAGSVQEYLETLDHNFEASQRFTENLALVMEKGLDDAIVQGWRDAGIASAGEVALWAKATDEEIKALNERMARNMEEGTQAASAVFKIGGADIVSGLVDGINAGLPQAQGAGQELAKATIDASNEAFGIHSPSKVYQDMMAFVIQGMVNGIKEGESDVVAAFQELALALATPFDELPKHIQEKLAQLAETLNLSGLNLNTVMLNNTQLMITSVLLEYAKLTPAIQMQYSTITQETLSWNTLMMQHGQAGARQFVSTIDTELKQLPDRYRVIFTSILNYLNSLTAPFSSAGRSFMGALFDAIRTVGRQIESWVDDWADRIEERIASMLEELEDAKRASRSSRGSSRDSDRSARSYTGQSHMQGLNYVPHNGYNAILHEGERVLTREQNRDYTGGKGEGDRTYIFNSPIALTPVEAARQMRQTELEMSLDFK